MNTTSKNTPLSRRLPLRMLFVALLAAGTAPAFARDAASDPLAIETRAESDLSPGEFEWNPERSTSGPLVVVVSLPEQMAHVYRGGVRIGRSTISSGKPGHDTPTGVFPILQKRRVHHSNLYDNAPMPFMQRLTWDGVALHAGKIPGHPASHGCVRLPKQFAEQLFEVTEHGVNVVVADDASHSFAVVYPGDTVPVNPITGLEPADGIEAIAASAAGEDMGRTAAR